MLAAGVLSLAAMGGASAATQSSCNAPKSHSVGKLGAITGTVMIDRGNGFVVAKTGDALKAGDKISVIGEGTAVFSYYTGGTAPLTVASSSTKTVCAKDTTAAIVPTTDPTLAIAGTLAAGAGAAALISTADGKSGTTVFFPVSP